MPSVISSRQSRVRGRGAATERFGADRCGRHVLVAPGVSVPVGDTPWKAGARQQRPPASMRCPVTTRPHSSNRNNEVTLRQVGGAPAVALFGLLATWAALAVACLIASRSLADRHDPTPDRRLRLPVWFPEAGHSVLVGMLAGSLIQIRSNCSESYAALPGAGL